MSELRPAYLFVGTDETKLELTKKRLAERVAQAGGQVDQFSGSDCKPEAVATALTSMTLLGGARVIVADGIEQWKAADVGQVVDALGAMPPDTSAVLITRKAPLAAIKQAVEQAGGEVREFPPAKPAELPGWVAEQATRIGTEIEPNAAQLLLALVGPNQQQLLREIEKLALFADAGPIDMAAVRAVACGEATPKIFDLTDAVLAGDPAAAIRLAEELMAGGERPGGIFFALHRALDQSHRAAALIDAGRAGDLATELRVSPWLAKKLAAQARTVGRHRLERSLVLAAEVDGSIKGASNLDDRTVLTRAVALLAA